MKNITFKFDSKETADVLYGLKQELAEFVNTHGVIGGIGSKCLDEFTHDKVWYLAEFSDVDNGTANSIAQKIVDGKFSVCIESADFMGSVS